MLILWPQKQGVAEPSFASSVIESLPPVGSRNRVQEETDARDAVGLGYIGVSCRT